MSRVQIIQGLVPQRSDGHFRIYDGERLSTGMLSDEDATLDDDLGVRFDGPTDSVQESAAQRRLLNFTDPLHLITAQYVCTAPRMQILHQNPSASSLLHEVQTLLPFFPAFHV